MAQLPRAMRVLLALGSSALCCSAAAAAPPPPGWPAWSWASPRSMLFFHSGNKTGFYSAASSAQISKYAAVTIEKFEGSEMASPRPAQWAFDEDMMIEELRRVDKQNPRAMLIFYMNGWKAKKQMTRMYEQWAAHPEWELFHDVRGADNKTGSCATKSGCAYDVSLPEVQEWWIQTCFNATRRIRPTGVSVGCYADASNTYPVDPQGEKTPNDAALLWPELSQTNAATRAKAAAWTAGLRAMTTAAQERLGDSGFIVGKTAIQPGVRALQIEGFSASNKSINSMQAAVRLGKLVEGHIGLGGSSGGPGHPGCGPLETNASMMEDHLAAFLIAAGPYCYFGCGQWDSQVAKGMTAAGGGLKLIDNAWVDNKLGAPLADGAMDSGGVWRRRFASGTAVSFDPVSNDGTIAWAGQPAPAPAPAPAPPAPPSPAGKKRLNVIHLNTDDQANLLGDMKGMPFFNEHVAAFGTRLENYYTNTPICCPSRTTTLSGRYFHNQREPSPTRGGCMHTTIKELDANGLPSWNK